MSEWGVIIDRIFREVGSAEGWMKVYLTFADDEVARSEVARSVDLADSLTMKTTRDAVVRYIEQKFSWYERFKGESELLVSSSSARNVLYIQNIDEIGAFALVTEALENYKEQAHAEGMDRED